MAAPTPRDALCRITCTRGSPTRVATPAVSSVLPSSTTKMASTQDGIVAMTSAIQRASLRAGTTTATESNNRESCSNPRGVTKHVSARGKKIAAVSAVLAVVVVLVVRWLGRFPADTTPEGAYLRIAAAIAKDEPKHAFNYLEESAQHAAFSIHGYAQKITTRIAVAYPETERQRAAAPYTALAAAEGGEAAFVLLAEREGWIGRLRRDLSGADQVEIVGERATIITARGTRYSFRRRPNGMWGLTLFTAELEAEAARLARDLEQVQQAAADYEREAASPAPAPSP